MRVYITNINGMARHSTAQIAQNMVTDIAVELGYRELGIYCYNMQADNPTELSKRLDGIIAGLHHGDVVIFQVPTWNTTAFDEKVMYKLRLFNIKIIIMIHDVVPLMFADSNFYLMERTIDYFNQADVIIAPSQQMIDYLRKYGLTIEKTVIQEMWDHPTQVPMLPASFKKEIHFPGSPERFSFVKNWDYSVPLHLYTTQKIDPLPQVIQESWMQEELLQMQLSKGGFGLIWMDTHDYEYMKLYCPYKLGLFLASGIPVIVPKEMANSDVIIKNKLGIVVDSLQEAVEKVENISEEEYQELVNRVRDFNRLIRHGYFTRKLLTEAVFKALQQ